MPMTTSLSCPCASLGSGCVSSRQRRFHPSRQSHPASGALTLCHCRTDAMAEIPRRLVGAFVLAPQRSLELHGAHALLGFQRAGRQGTTRQRQVRIVEDRATRNRELVLTPDTFKPRIFFSARNASILAARTLRLRASATAQAVRGNVRRLRIAHSLQGESWQQHLTKRNRHWQRVPTRKLVAGIKQDLRKMLESGRRIPSPSQRNQKSSANHES